MHPLFPLAAAIAAVASPAPHQAAAAPEPPSTRDLSSATLTTLIREMVASSPPSWQQGVLTIQSDGVRITYQLLNAGHPDRAQLSGALIDAIDALYLEMEAHGSVWRSARITFTRTGGDGVTFDTSFDYGDDAPTAPSVGKPRT